MARAQSGNTLPNKQALTDCVVKAKASLIMPRELIEGGDHFGWSSKGCGEGQLLVFGVARKLDSVVTGRRAQHAAAESQVEH